MTNLYADIHPSECLKIYKQQGPTSRDMSMESKTCNQSYQKILTTIQACKGEEMFECSVRIVWFVGLRDWFTALTKLDGVGPVVNRPSTD